MPEVVLKQAADEMLDWRGKGLSVMEMSHRSPEYTEIFQEALSSFRTLLDVPSNYHVLFMQGGAVGQNAIVPLNLLKKNKQAAFITNGSWSQKTYKEFSKYGQATVVASASEPSGSYPANAYVPDLAQLVEKVNGKQYAYLHYCDNETIGGVEFNKQIEQMADDLDCPIVCDMSSNILSRPVDVSKYGVIYGGAQKNIGPAGVTVVVVREDLLDLALEICPSAFHFQQVAQAGSMLNTPPTYSIYIAGLVFKWLSGKGGVSWAGEMAKQKASLLYECIDTSSLYSSPVRPSDRSRMNVPFVLNDSALDSVFLEKATLNGLSQLKGHKSVGGMRASIYNAMSLEGVQALVEFMRAFEREAA